MDRNHLDISGDVLLPQYSSISCVSGMPPIIEPAIDARFVIRLNTLTAGRLVRQPNQRQRTVLLEQPR